MIDVAITSEGYPAADERNGWKVRLIDGTTITAWRPSAAIADGRWAALCVMPDGETGSGHAHTLVAAISKACQAVEFEGRTAHVLATMTVHLA